MKRHQTVLSVLVVSLALSLGLLISGCGEKIAIPQAKGVFSLDEYTVDETYEVDGPAIQLTRGGSFLFVLTPGTLSKYETDFDLQFQVTGLEGPLALCVDGEADFVFVWEDDTKSVVWYDTIDGQRLGSSSLPEVQTVTGMATNPSVNPASARGADIPVSFGSPIGGDPPLRFFPGRGFGPPWCFGPGRRGGRPVRPRSGGNGDRQ